MNDGHSPSGRPERSRASRGRLTTSLRDPPGARGPEFQRRPRPGALRRPGRAAPLPRARACPWEVRPQVLLGRSRVVSKARKAHRVAAGSPPPPRPTPHPRRGVCPTCASCASCPCPIGPRCPPPAPGPGRAAPLPVRARRAEGGSGARETPRREAVGRRAPGGARPLTRRRRETPGGSPRAATGQRAAGTEAGERARRARRVRLAAHGGPWRLEVALQPAGRGQRPSRGRGQARSAGHRSESPLFFYHSPSSLCLSLFSPLLDFLLSFSLPPFSVSACDLSLSFPLFFFLSLYPLFLSSLPSLFLSLSIFSPHFLPCLPFFPPSSS